MALYSPGIETREIDAGASVQEAGSTPGAVVIPGEWGPADQRVLITSETELVNRFGEPNNSNYREWFSAANFLAYVGAVYAVRAIADDALNANDDGVGILIKNDEEFEGITTSGETFIARYAGDMGNSLRVEVCDNTTTFSGWAYADQFNSAPGTSTHASQFGSSNDELHVVVVDEDGLISETPGTVLETYSYLSKASDAKNDFGGKNYYVDVLNSESAYVFVGTEDLVTASGTELSYGDSSSGAEAFASSDNIIATSLTGGTLGGGAGSAELTTAMSLFESPEDVDIGVIITGAGGEQPGSTTHAVLDQAITIAESRKDCVVGASPMVIGSTGAPSTTPYDDTDSFFSSVTRSSYVFADSGYKYQFDRYNDTYRWVPLNGDVMGLVSRLDRDYEPWFSPAGFTRGNILNVTKLAWNPNQTQRDNLYKQGINSVVNFPGQGTVLFGDKTFVSKPGAFDRINVRRLFIVLRKSVSDFAQSILFEQNDAFTRAQFTSAVEQFLANIQARRGIDDFRVIADDSNNTPTVINNNQFVGDIFVRPLNSINFIRLNFIAVRAGVEFSEIAG